MDNTATGTRRLQREAALAATFNGLGFNTDGSPKFRLGVMFSTETGSGDSNVDGGYIRAAIRDLTSANKTAFVNLVNSLDWCERTNRTAARPARPWRRRMSISGSRTLYRQQQEQVRLPEQQLRTGGVKCNPGHCPTNYGTPSAALQGGVAVHEPARERQLRRQLHHLHQQRRGAGQQRRQQHATTWLQNQATAVGLGTGATTTIRSRPAARSRTSQTSGRAS